MTWTWLRRGNLKREKESQKIALQNNLIKTNYIKAQIDNTLENNRHRLCGDRDKTIRK